MCNRVVFLIVAVLTTLSYAHREDGDFSSDGRVIRDNKSSLFVPDIHPEAESSILDFTTANIRRITHRQPSHDAAVAKSILENIEKQLNFIQAEYPGNLYNLYGRSKNNRDRGKQIKKCLKLFRQYLDDRNYQRQQLFFEAASTLPVTLKAILDDKLFDSNLDSLTSVRKAVHCHGRKLKTAFQSMMRIFMAGFWVYTEYRYVSHANHQSNSSLFKTSIMLPSKKLLKKLDNEVFLCRTDERNISKEMHRILLNLTLDQETRADNLLRFLEDKYDTKKWVAVVKKEEHSENAPAKEFPSRFQGNFHTSTTNGFFAAAVSIDRKSASEFQIWLRERFNSSVANDHDRLLALNVNSDVSSNKYAVNFRSENISSEKMRENGSESLVNFTLCTSSNVTIATSVGLFTDYLSCSDLEQLEILNNKSNSQIDNIFSSASEVNTLELSPLANGENVNIIIPVTAGTDELREKKNIEERMRQILMRKDVPYYDRVGVADSLLHMLEDTFEDAKKWIVIVISDVDGGRTIAHFQSEGFFTASDSDGSLFASAVSINRSDEDPHVWKSFKDQLETFEFPKNSFDLKTDSSEEDEGAPLKWIDSAPRIYQHLNNHFGQLWAGKMESAVITTPCNDRRKLERIFNYATIVATSDLQWMPVASQDRCSQRLIISLPTVARDVERTKKYHDDFQSVQDGC